MRYAANRNRGSSLQSASGPTLGVSCPPSGAFLLHTLSSGPLPLHWDPRFRGLIDAQDQLLTDFSLCPRSRPLGGTLESADSGDPKSCPHAVEVYRTAISRLQTNSSKAWKNQTKPVQWAGPPAGLGGCLSSEFGAGQRCTPLLPVWLRTPHHLSQQLIFTEGQQSWKICIQKKQFEEETWKFFVIQFF